MRIAATDMWMVRVSLSESVTPLLGRVERYTAVDLDTDDHTPGVYPLLAEHARLERTQATGGWSALLRRVEARNDDAARAIAAATYDAARGFLALGLSPTGGPVAAQTPDVLTVEVGDLAWTFPAASAPAEAWAVLRRAAQVAIDVALWPP